MAAIVRSLRDFWREYRRHRIGIVGLGLLIVLVATALLFPLVGNQEIIDAWVTDLQYFQDFPQAVPPCWAGRLTGREDTETIILSAEDLVVESSSQGYARLSISAPVEVTGAQVPSDVVIRGNFYYNLSKPPLYIYQVRVDRPDGLSFYLVKPPEEGVEGLTPLYLVGTVFTGLPSKSLNASNFRIGLQSITSKPVLVTSWVYDELEAMGIDTTGLSPVDVSLRLYDVIFSKDVDAAFKGNESEVLRGRYTLVIEFVAREGVIEFKPFLGVVKGSCYGLLGTDRNGRDLFQGLVYGVRWALIIGLLTSFITVIVGALYGIIAGYLGGRVGEAMLRFAQIVYALPALPLLILLAALYKPSIWIIILLLVVFGWPGISFVTRSMAKQIREETYVEAAIATGAGNRRIILLYVFPQILPYLFASMALSVPGAVLTEAGLSFLGLGDPNIVTWGKILYDAQNAAAAINGYWWWVVPPGLAIALVGMTFIFIGNALDVILNPRLKR